MPAFERQTITRPAMRSPVSCSLFERICSSASCSSDATQVGVVILQPSWAVMSVDGPVGCDALRMIMGTPVSISCSIVRGWKRRTPYTASSSASS